MKPVLVLITSEKCGACKHFKQKIWPRLGMYLRKDTRFEVVEIHVMDTANEIRRVHTDLVRFVGWFPTIMLFTGESWVSTLLKGKVLNGEFIGDRITHYQDIPIKIKEQVLLEHRRIYEWIEKTLQDEMFSSGNPAVVITDSSSTDSFSKRLHEPTIKVMYDSETEFVESTDEFY